MTDDPVLRAWQAQLTAMDAGDTAGLREVFSADATLTHMTGHVQSLDDWLAGMERRDFVYHRIAEREVSIDRRTATTARLVGRIVTGITDDGSGQAWPLRLEQDYTQVSGAADTRTQWRCTASRVTYDG